MSADDFPRYWTYNDTRIEELDRASLIEVCNTACDEIHRQQEEIHRLRKELGAWMKNAALDLAQGPWGNA